MGQSAGREKRPQSKKRGDAAGEAGAHYGAAREREHEHDAEDATVSSTSRSNASVVEGDSHGIDEETRKRLASKASLLKEMFPELDAETVLSVLEISNGDVEQAVAMLMPSSPARHGRVQSHGGGPVGEIRRTGHEVEDDGLPLPPKTAESIQTLLVTMKDPASDAAFVHSLRALADMSLNPRHQAIILDSSPRVLLDLLLASVDADVNEDILSSVVSTVANLCLTEDGQVYFQSAAKPLSLLLLKHTSVEVLLQCCRAVANLSFGSRENEGILQGEGGVMGLIRAAVEGRDADLKEEALAALANLCQHPKIAEDVIRSRNVINLIDLCKDKSEEVAKQALRAVGNLCIHPGVRETVAKYTVDLLIEIVADSEVNNLPSPLLAVRAVANLSHDSSVASLLARRRAGRALLHFLLLTGEEGSVPAVLKVDVGIARAEAAEAISLLTVPKSSRRLLLHDVGLDPLLQLVRSHDPLVQLPAARAISNLSSVVEQQPLPSPTRATAASASASAKEGHD